MVCKYCNEQHPNYFTYCPKTSQYIGQAQVKYTYAVNDFCLSCGEKNDSGGTFCSQCGTSTVQRVEQKSTLNKVLSDTIKNVNVPNVGSIKGEDIKAASKEKVHFFKKNPLFFVPIAVSILLIVVFTFIAKSSVLEVITADMSTEEAALVKAVIEDPTDLEDMFYEEVGMRMEFPQIFSIPRFVTVLHNVKVEWSFNTDNTVFSATMDNMFFALLFLPLLALVIGGILYGMMARKHNWPLYQGIAYSTVLYVLVMIVLAIVSKLNVGLSEEETFGEFMLNVTMNYSVLDMMITASILSIVGFGFAATVTYFNKGILEKLSYQVKYVQYAIFSIAITIVGIVFNFLNVYFGMDKKSFPQDMPIEITGTVKLFSSIYLGVWNWISSFFSELELALKEYGSNARYTHSLFGSEKSELYNSYLFNNWFGQSDLSLLPSFLLVLVSVGLIGAAGYILYIVHRLNWKECLTFAGIFTLLQLMLLYLINVQVDGIFDYGEVALTLSFKVISSCLLVFVVAFVSFYVGGFVRQYQLKK